MHHQPGARCGRRRMHALGRPQDVGRVTLREIDDDVAALQRTPERFGSRRVAEAVVEAEVRAATGAPQRAHDRDDVDLAFADRHLQEARANESSGAKDRYAAAQRRALQCRASASACSIAVSQGMRSELARS